MDKVYAKLVKQATTPSVGDISQLLKAIGKQGEKRDEKKAAVEKLFNELGVRAHNPQGYHVVDSLDAYGDF